MRRLTPSSVAPSLLAPILFALIFVGCSTSNELPYYATPDLAPRWGAEAQHIVDFDPLTDQSGSAIGAEDLSGTVYVANFFFSRCTGVCPTLRTRLSGVQELELPGVELVSFSVDPDNDSSDVLAAYARVNEIDSSRWHLLTGGSRKIVSLARDGFFVDGITESGFVHTETVYLVDGEGQIRGVYNGTQAFDIERLTEDLYRLKGLAMESAASHPFSQEVERLG